MGWAYAHVLIRERHMYLILSRRFEVRGDTGVTVPLHPTARAQHGVLSFKASQ
jgi:hypothetical protein